MTTPTLGPKVPASYRELRDAEPTFSAAFAARFFGIGRNAVPSALAAGTFPVPVIQNGRLRIVTKSALLRALDLTPEGLDVLARMEQEREDRAGETVEPVAS